jgi:DNA-binding SARP family transcriptional activator
MATLRIHLFGQLQVYLGERYLNKSLTRKAQHLFCYLVLHRQNCHSRDLLAGLFWGDSPEEQARKCLRTSLWRLRSCLEPDGSPKGTYLVIENDDICFNSGCDYWLDVEEFEKGLAAVQLPIAPDVDARYLDHEMLSTLTRAVALYQDDLLEGCYEDWCLYERERLQGLFLSALAKLMACHRSQGTYEEAIRCGQRILSYDPLLEEVHRELMRLHCLAGNRGAALRQYRLCQAVLSRELGIEPMEETTALYTQVCHGEEATGEGRKMRDPNPTWLSDEPGGRMSGLRRVDAPLASRVDDALRELRLMQAGFQQLSARLQREVEVLETIRQELG